MKNNPFRYLLAGTLAVMAIVIASEFSPIYNFPKPTPFSGPDIYNPYASLDTSIGWKRANFHTHTKVDNIFNECPRNADTVYADYRKFGYDILTFSNHNQLTDIPEYDSLKFEVYEHGYNLFKFHKLVFSPERMILHDIVFPIIPSQKQFEYDYLSRNADFIVMNHPDRTGCMSAESMEKLSGYRLMEVDCGVSTECERWDQALSAGHYSIAIADDDNHDSRVSRKIAVRCSWQNVADVTSKDEIRKCLLEGNGYAMRIPDFGDGDWDEKYRKNRNLPKIKWIGLCGEDTVKVEFDRAVSSILAIGQNRTMLDSASNCTSFYYAVRPEDSYVRLKATFDDGVVIYTNTFARYDSKKSETPWVESPHSVNWPLTLLFNLFLIALIAGIVLLIRGCFPHVKGKA